VSILMSGESDVIAVSNLSLAFDGSREIGSGGRFVSAAMGGGSKVKFSGTASVRPS
jgi:hypothetical protein